MSKGKIIRNLIFVFAIFLLVILMIIGIGDIKQIFNVLSNTKISYIFLAILFVLLYAITYQASLMILTKYRYKNIKFIDLFAISGTEFFFNAITPFSSGGQPFQAYALKRKNMKLSDSTSALLINFIAYQVCLNILGVIFIILYYSRVYEQINTFIVFLIVGFTINVVIMVGLILLGTVKPVGKLFIFLFDKLTKIKFLKKLANKREDFVIYIDNMQTAFKEIIKSFKIWVLILLTKIISFLLYYSIPFIALYAIGVSINMADLPYTIALTAFVLTIAIWVPTPGASGGVEYAFKQLYSPFIEGYGYTANEALQISLAVMMLWRLLTYYFLILYGFILYLIFEKRDRKNSNNLVQEDKNSDIIVTENFNGE